MATQEDRGKGGRLSSAPPTAPARPLGAETDVTPTLTHGDSEERPKKVAYDLGAGTLIAGGYRVEGPIGSGGMGSVFRAVHPVLKRAVAVKVMHKNADEMRFETEAKAIAILSHANIVDVQDSGFLKDGSPYIVMEFLDGRPLRQHLKDKRPDADSCLRIALQMCAGLAHAHSQGVVHRDIKPANIILSPNLKQLKLLDFGIAKLVEKDDDAFKTSTQMVLGTPQYMSPEQARQSSTVTASSDVYTVGLILYELLTGELPYRVQSPGDLIFHVMSQKGAAADLDPVPRPWRPIVGRCLQADPTKRYSTAAELLRDICVRIDDAMDAAEAAIPDDFEALQADTDGLRRDLARQRRNRNVVIGVVAVVLVGATALAINTIDQVTESSEVPPAPVIATPPAEEPLAVEAEPEAIEAEPERAPTAPIEVSIVSDPEGAEIEIPSIGISNVAPFTAQLPLGEYVITARLDGVEHRQTALVTEDSRSIRLQIPRRRRRPPRGGRSSETRMTTMQARVAPQMAAEPVDEEPEAEASVMESPEPTMEQNQATPMDPTPSMMAFDPNALFRSRQ